MATITAATSNIDVNSIVSQLMTIEQQPLSLIKKDLTGIQTKLSAFGKLQGALAKFQDASRALMKKETWEAAGGKSGDETVVGVKATTGALTGSYSLAVEQLAQRQSLASTPFVKDAVIGAGTLRIQLGTVNAAGTGFTANPDKPEAEITIPAGATLNDIRTAINGADVGVKASIVTDNSGQRLMLRSADSGEAGGFRIVGDGALTAFTYDPAGTKTLTRTETAQDARYTINGLAMTSASNTVDGAIENVTLELKKKTDTPANISIASDAEAVRKSADTFVTAYNELNKLLAEQTKYDEATKTAGVLQGNRTAVGIQTQVREILRSTISGMTEGDPTRLVEAGLELQRDGSLQVKAGKFEEAAANPTKMLKLFGASDPDDPTKVGIARRLDKRLSELLGADGAISGAQDSLKARQKMVEQKQTRFEDRLTLIEARLRRQYTALDKNLSQISGAGNALIAQLSSLSSS